MGAPAPSSDEHLEQSLAAAVWDPQPRTFGLGSALIPVRERANAGRGTFVGGGSHLTELEHLRLTDRPLGDRVGGWLDADLRFLVGARRFEPLASSASRNLESLVRGLKWGPRHVLQRCDSVESCGHVTHSVTQ